MPAPLSVRSLPRAARLEGRDQGLITPTPPVADRLRREGVLR